jgi:hypothetical protein
MMGFKKKCFKAHAHAPAHFVNVAQSTARKCASLEKAHAGRGYRFIVPNISYFIRETETLIERTAMARALWRDA